MTKIEKYLEIEKDSEKRAYGEMALEECEFFLYEPKNEKEEKELMLCEFIKRRERRIDDLTIKIDGVEMRLEKLALEKKVHKKVLESNKSKQEDWQYFWLEDFVGMEKMKYLTKRMNMVDYLWFEMIPHLYRRRQQLLSPLSQVI